jgi:FkbM family methyltransferase
LRAGLDVHRLDLSHSASRVATLRRHRITVVLDVGANTGQYVDWLRSFGYHQRVVSFEPVPEVFEELRERLQGDELWLGVQAAVGAQSGTATMHVTHDSKCSSLLTPRRIDDYIPGAAVADSVEVALVSLDDQWDEFVRPDDRVALKVDVQGFEAAVLDGVADHVQSVSVIEVEVSLSELYEGAAAPAELLGRLGQDGFNIVSLDRGFVDSETGQVLDIDVLFERRDTIVNLTT